MLELLTAQEMQQADAAAIAGGADSFALMTAAGQAVADRVQQLVAPSCRIAVVAGSGNNGGDGAVVARLLETAGFRVSLIRVGRRAPARADARRAFAEWSGETLAFDSEPPAERQASAVPGETAGEQVTAGPLATIATAGLIVDALLGAGLDRDLDAPLCDLIAAINAAPGLVVSVDLPSGVDGNRCSLRGAAVQADHTVTFFRYKPAHLLYPGRACCGRLELAQIGLPETVLEGLPPPRCFINDPALWQARLPVPSASGHKFDRGHVIVRGGPLLQAGAARLSAQAALQCGAGLVSLASPVDALVPNAAQLTAVMLRCFTDSLDWSDLISDTRINTVVIGPGNGIGASTRQCVEAALVYRKACVIDADALSSCAEQPEALFDCIAESGAQVVLTPHAGEFERLFPDLTTETTGSRLQRARAAAARAGGVVVFKGADTVVAAADGGAVINDNAPAWLATAGAGDVLGGVIASLMAQGLDAFDAACAGVWLHGAAAARLGYPMTAEQLVPACGEALGRIADLGPPLPLQGVPIDRVATSGPHRRSPR